MKEGGGMEGAHTNRIIAQDCYSRHYDLKQMRPRVLVESTNKKLIDVLRKSRGLHSVSAYRHGLYIYRYRPAGVAQSRRAFVGGTVSTWARWRIPVNKGRKGIRNADQALTVRGEHADRIVGSPSWESIVNYNRCMPVDLKLSQIGSSQLPPLLKVVM